MPILTAFCSISKVRKSDTMRAAASAGAASKSRLSLKDLRIRRSNRLDAGVRGLEISGCGLREARGIREVHDFEFPNALPSWSICPSGET